MTFLRDRPWQLDRAVVDAGHLPRRNPDLVLQSNGSDPDHPFVNRYERSRMAGHGIKFGSAHGADGRRSLQRKLFAGFQLFDFGKDSAGFKMGLRLTRIQGVKFEGCFGADFKAMTSFGHDLDLRVRPRPDGRSFGDFFARSHGLPNQRS